MRGTRSIFSLAVLIFSLSLCSVAFSQTDVNVEQGLKPYGSYMGGNLDTVSLTNGNLMLHIPLVSYPQRGGRLKLSFFLRYNNKGFYIRHWTFTNGNGQQQTASAWTWDGVGVDVARDQVVETRSTRGPFSAPQSGETTNAQFYLTLTNFITADGSSHTVSGMKDGGPSFGGGILDGSALGYFGIQDTLDSTAVSTTYPACPDGTTYSSFYPLVSIDPNGNKITTTGSGWVDTLGRQIPGESICTSSSPLYMGGAGAILGIPGSTFGSSFTSGSGITSGDNIRMLPGVKTTNLTGCPSNAVSARLWNLPAFNNSTATMKFCYANFQLATNFAVPNVPEVQGTYTMLQNVILPNGTMWTFNYNSYGDVSYVGFPTGGSISYGWNNYQFCSGTSRTITSRAVNANDGAGAQTWNYAWTPATGSAPTTLVLTDPAGNDSVHVSSCFYETEARYYQGTSSNSNNLLKTVDTSYQSFGNAFDEYTSSNTSPSFPTTVTTTWPNGKVSTIQNTYDTPTSYTAYDYLCVDCATHPFPMTYTRINGQTTLESLFDFGNTTTPIRKTATTYYTIDDPSTVITYDGSGNKCAETDYAYDDANRLVASGVSEQHGAPYTGAVRANSSSITRWLTSTPCSPSASWSQVTSYTNYNDTGTLAASIDPLGHITAYAYSPTFYGAYVTQTTMPSTSSPNPASHIISGNYDFNTGLLASFTDQNGQTSSYGYDNMERLTTATYPLGGQTSFTYTDTGNINVERNQTLASSRTTDLFAYFDGLGRETRRMTANDESSPWDQVDTCYDVLGNVQFKSYPYQGTGLSSPKVCSGLGDAFTYDGLGRTLQVAHSDGSTVLTSYTGAATSVSDEGNGTQRVQRISQVDALGRLTSICEVTNTTLIGTTPTPGTCPQDISATGFLTSYSYDPLGNLLSVTQGGLSPRTFQYDSFSRLLSASNPESGIITYGYDNDSRLTTRTAPKPNQTSASVTVTTTMNYDELHRLRTKTYSDNADPYPTPSATFNYDEASDTTLNASGLSYTIGRPSASVMQNAQGQTIAGEIFSYDQRGRTVVNSQCTPLNCGSGLFSVAYTYNPNDVLGEVVSSTNGVGVTLSYAYNRSARLTSLTSSLNDANHPATLISGLHYSGFGTETAAALGNSVGEALSYAPRGWLQTLSATNPSGGTATPGTGSTAIGGALQTIPATSATSGSGSVTVGGALQSKQVLSQAAKSGSASITINGAEQSFYDGSDCRLVNHIWICTTYYDQGTVSLTINGMTKTVSYSQTVNTGSTQVATALANAFQGDSTSPVNASVSGSTITATARATGVATNYSFSFSTTWWTAHFSSPSYSASPGSGNLSGGADAVYTTVYDTGTVSITVNGFSQSVNYGNGSTTSTIASALATALNSSGSPVSASVNASVVNLTSNTTGAATNYSLSATSQTTNSSQFSSPSFTATPSAATLTGGHDSTPTIYDSGTVWLTVNGTQFSASYGQGDTSSSVANSLAQAINGSSNSTVTASASSSSVVLTSKLRGSATNYSLSAGSSTNQSSNFSQPSFTAAASGSALTGGADNPPIYTLNITSFAPDGNILTANDGVNGNWTYSYDSFNRLVGANQNNAQAVYSYDYDRFGNRWHQNGPASMMLTFSANNNRMDGYSYDAAGNLLGDSANNQYTYDAEGRIVMLISPGTGTSCYFYNAEGQRVRKTTGSTNSCGTPPTGASVDFLYDISGHQIAEVNSSGGWNRAEVYAAGRHLATYNNGTTYFIHGDWLGTERARSTTSGVSYETCTSLPFGDWLTCSGSDPSPMHFTGKERDSESGLDNFGARYYGSSLARFATPDPIQHPSQSSWDEELFLAIPQRWNRYSYVLNNPMIHTDPAGAEIPVWEASDPKLNPPRTAKDKAWDVVALYGAAASFFGAVEAAGSVIVRNLVSGTITYLFTPQGQQTVANVAEGLSNAPPGSMGSLTLSAASRLSASEFSTGLRLAQQKGLQLFESSHVGEEFFDAAGRTYDAMGSARAYAHWNPGEFFNALKDHLNKMINFVVVDLNGASKEQIAAIMKYLSSLPPAQRARIVIVR